MPYPNVDTLPALTDTFGAAKSEITNARRSLPQIRDLMAAGNVSANLIVHNLVQNIKNTRAVLVAARDTPGMRAYVRDQLNDPAFNLTTQTNAIVAAIDNTLVWVAANIPTDASGWMLLWKMEADGGITTRSFTPTQTAGLRTELDALITAIG